MRSKDQWIPEMRRNNGFFDFLTRLLIFEVLAKFVLLFSTEETLKKFAATFEKVLFFA